MLVTTCTNTINSNGNICRNRTDSDCNMKWNNDSNSSNGSGTVRQMNSTTKQSMTNSSPIISSSLPSQWVVGIYKKKCNYVIWNVLSDVVTEKDAQDVFQNNTLKKKKKTMVRIAKMMGSSSSTNIRILSSSSSMVLFNANKGTPVSFWSVNSSFDIAIILYAFEQNQEQQQKTPNYQYSPSCIYNSTTTFINRSHVKELVQDGYLPLVPITRQNRPIQEWLLKRSVDYTFSRPTVQYFACTPLRYGRSTLYFFDIKTYPNVKGHVALTIDDAPCRRFASSCLFPNNNSQFASVLDILQEYNAHATFMIIGQYATATSTSNCKDNQHDDHHNHNEQDLINAVHKGHELGNHGMMDRSYHKDDPSEFAKAVDECNDIIQQIYHKAENKAESDDHKQSPISSLLEEQQQQDANKTSNINNDNPTNKNRQHKVKWFRAPHGKYTKEMEQVLLERNLQNVMCDTYASCPIIQDGTYIGTSLAQKCTHGSILLLHMPEVGFRDWCLIALEQLMKGLLFRGFQVVTVSELERLAKCNDQGNTVTDPENAANFKKIT